MKKIGLGVTGDTGGSHSRGAKQQQVQAGYRSLGKRNRRASSAGEIDAEAQPDVVAISDTVMPSHFRNKSLTYSAGPDANAYFRWLVSMLANGESIDAMIDLKHEEHNQNRLSGRLASEEFDSELPNDYVATSIQRQAGMGSAKSEGEFEVEMI